MVKIKVRSDIGEREIEADLYEPFAVHKDIGLGRLWKVTHILTGCCFQGACKTKKKAVERAKQLQTIKEEFKSDDYKYYLKNKEKIQKLLGNLNA